jgi:uncharacterized protein
MLNCIWVRSAVLIAASTLCLSIGSCSRKPDQTAISSGTPNSFYSRLAEQIGTSARETSNIETQNLESQGSSQNLQRLLERKADFALVQLDVATEAMRQGKVQAVAILADEPIHLIVQKDTKLRSLNDLESKRVSMGAAGSGIRFTSEFLMKSANLNIREDSSGFDDSFRKLIARQVDALIYVGSTGASEKLRRNLVTNPSLQLIPIQSETINYVVARSPDAYQSATIQAGTYSARPPIPAENISTLATATVLVTRPDIPEEKVGLVTWSILDNSRKFSHFYPELQKGEASALLQRGLFYLHPAAKNVYALNADPRQAWLRYLESNNDLQAGLLILFGSSGIGLFLQFWKRDRSKKLVAATTKRIGELKQLLPQNPQQALAGIEELGQEHRLMFVEGAIASEVYEQVRQKTQSFAEQCREILNQQRKKFVLDTLLLLDDWQASLQVDPQTALDKLTQIKQQYREMLLTDQVEIDAYMQLVELTLISVMTLAPRTEFFKSDPISSN